MAVQKTMKTAWRRVSPFVAHERYGRLNGLVDRVLYHKTLEDRLPELEAKSGYWQAKYHLDLHRRNAGDERLPTGFEAAAARETVERFEAKQREALTPVEDAPKGWFARRVKPWFTRKPREEPTAPSSKRSFVSLLARLPGMKRLGGAITRLRESAALGRLERKAARAAGEYDGTKQEITFQKEVIGRHLRGFEEAVASLGGRKGLGQAPPLHNPGELIALAELVEALQHRGNLVTGGKTTWLGNLADVNYEHRVTSPFDRRTLKAYQKTGIQQYEVPAVWNRVFRHNLTNYSQLLKLFRQHFDNNFLEIVGKGERLSSLGVSEKHALKIAENVTHADEDFERAGITRPAEGAELSVEARQHLLKTVAENLTVAHAVEAQKKMTAPEHRQMFSNVSDALIKLREAQLKTSIGQTEETYKYNAAIDLAQREKQRIPLPPDHLTLLEPQKHDFVLEFRGKMLPVSEHIVEHQVFSEQGVNRSASKALFEAIQKAMPTPAARKKKTKLGATGTTAVGDAETFHIHVPSDLNLGGGKS